MGDTCDVETSAVENTVRKFAHFEMDWDNNYKGFYNQKR